MHASCRRKGARICATMPTKPPVVAFIWGAQPGSVRQRAEIRAEIVRPDHYGKHRLPERQVQKSDCEEPPCNPRKPHGTVLLNSNFLHTAKYTRDPGES